MTTISFLLRLTGFSRFKNYRVNNSKFLNKSYATNLYWVGLRISLSKTGAMLAFLAPDSNNAMTTCVLGWRTPTIFNQN